jgi:DNA-binding transcriptional ArsR family regulator
MPISPNGSFIESIDKCAIVSSVDLLDFLVTSNARKTLLKVLLLEDGGGSVSEVARRAGIQPSTADRELERMEACGLVSSERVGKEKVVKPNVHSSDVRYLRRLLAGRAPSDRDRQQDDSDTHVRAALAHYGAPLFVPGDAHLQDVPAPEATLAAALRQAHLDPAVAGNLPVVLWRNRQLDVNELVRLAARAGDGQTLGFFLELTDQLAGQTLFSPAAQPLKDKRRRKLRNFFSRDGKFSAYEKDLATMNTPEVARRWNFLMNMSLESFASYFRKGTQPSVHLAPA